MCSAVDNVCNYIRTVRVNWKINIEFFPVGLIQLVYYCCALSTQRINEQVSDIHMK